MSEEEKYELGKRLLNAIRDVQFKMLERRAKLGEKVVMSDENGNPITVSASDALTIYHNIANQTYDNEDTE